MDQEAKVRAALSDYLQVILFAAFIGLFFVLNLILPAKEFSEKENRSLEQAPNFSAESLFSGRFTAAFERYTTDQFTLRDEWITLKARSETISGKSENNGVYLCADGVLITRFDEPDYELVGKNTAALDALTDKTALPVYLAIIPGKADIWSDKLPSNAPTTDQRGLIENIYANAPDTEPVDIYSALDTYKDEYIYYKTDHHWTTLGAYYGYAAIMDSLGMEARSLDFFERETVTTEFYGTTSSSSGIWWTAPDSIEIFVTPPDSVEVANFASGQAELGLIYDMSFLEKKDKYSLFLGGVSPLVQIHTGSDGPSLLIARDSYADSLVPFLLERFSRIDLVDLRYFRESFNAYIMDNGFDCVLICYSTENFAKDTSIYRLAE